MNSRFIIGRCENLHPHVPSDGLHDRFICPHWFHSNALLGTSALFARQKSSTLLRRRSPKPSSNSKRSWTYACSIVRPAVSRSPRPGRSCLARSHPHWLRFEIRCSKREISPSAHMACCASTPHTSDTLL